MYYQGFNPSHRTDSYIVFFMAHNNTYVGYMYVLVKTAHETIFYTLFPFSNCLFNESIPMWKVFLSITAMLVIFLYHLALNHSLLQHLFLSIAKSQLIGLFEECLLSGMPREKTSCLYPCPALDVFMDTQRHLVCRETLWP